MIFNVAPDFSTMKTCFQDSDGKLFSTQIICQPSYQSKVRAEWSHFNMQVLKNMHFKSSSVRKPLLRKHSKALGYLWEGEWDDEMIRVMVKVTYFFLKQKKCIL